jgi:hypothetical protein
MEIEKYRNAALLKHRREQQDKSYQYAYYG